MTDLTARLLDALTRGDHDQHDALYMEVLRALKKGARIVEPDAVVAAHPTGPDQGDPAAWLVADKQGRRLYVSTTEADVQQFAAGRLVTVVPLYRRTPGAVASAPPSDKDGTGPRRPNADPDRARALAAALRDLPAPSAEHEDEAAAPPGDEEPGVDQPTADIGEVLGGRFRDGAAERTRSRVVAGWRLVPPAPSAGHEDEAAVERAAQPTGLASIPRDRTGGVATPPIRLSAEENR